MTRPLNSLVNSAASGGTAATSGEWAAKLAAANQAGGGDASALKSDFSRWMDQHAASAKQSQTAPPAPAASGRAEAGQGGANGNSVEARNALARAQANAAQAKRQAPVAHKAESAHAPKAEKPKTESAGASKPPAKTEASSKGKAREADDKSDKASDAAEGDAAANAAAATETPEAAAKAQPLSDGVAPGDASSMLAWLARLTQGDISPKAAGGLQGGGSGKAGADEQPNGAAVDMSSLLGGGKTLAGAGAAQDKGPAGGIDVSALQAAEGRLATLPEAGDPSAKGLDFNSTLSTEMMRGLAGKAGEAQAAAPTASETLATPMSSPEFPQALAEQVGMWVKSTGEDGTLSAELHLNPAEMGPISVKISLDGQSAQVDFAAAALETRRAIEQSLPMLSAALDDAGFSLGGSGVSDQPPQQQFGQAGQPGGTPSWGGGRDGASGGDQVEGRAVRAPQAGRKGGLDLYA